MNKKFTCFVMAAKNLNNTNVFSQKLWWNDERLL